MPRGGPWQWLPPTTPCLTPPPMERLFPARWCGAHWNHPTPPNPGAWAVCGLHPLYDPLQPFATRRWGTVFLCSQDFFIFFINADFLIVSLFLPPMYRILVKVLRVWRNFFLSVSLRGNSPRRNSPWGKVCLKSFLFMFRVCVELRCTEMWFFIYIYIFADAVICAFGDQSASTYKHLFPSRLFFVRYSCSGRRRADLESYWSILHQRQNQADS